MEIGFLCVDVPRCKVASGIINGAARLLCFIGCDVIDRR